MITATMAIMKSVATISKLCGIVQEVCVEFSGAKFTVNAPFAGITKDWLS